ncbi:MAG TPA: WG repeat-containing protein [Pyrinomonadaceae bacterium]|jgi:hypothetical protein
MFSKSIYCIRSCFFIFILFVGIHAQNNQSEVFRPIQENGKWGYVDKNGKVVIQPQFYWAEEFSEGLAAFENDEGLHGYVDVTGKIVIEPKFSNWSDFSEGVAAVAIDIFQYGFIDKAGNWIIEPKFAHSFPFRDGLAPIRLLPPKGQPLTPGREKSAFIDKTGKIVLEPPGDILNARTSEGFAFLQIIQEEGAGVKEVIVDRAGNILIEAEKIELDGFSEGLTPVKKNGKWGYIDVTGKFVIEPQFAEAKSFSEGLAAVQVGENWGYINKQGKLVIPAKFEMNSLNEGDKHSFSEGLALVYQSDRCVYLNQTGKAVIKIDCSDGGKFIGGLALIKLTEGDKEKRGYINKTGKFVWRPTLFRYKTYEDIQAQIKKSREKEGKSDDEEKLLPLTEEEKTINYRNLVANQPDFIADLSYFRSEQFSGGGFGYRLVRKGNKYRKESQFWIFVGETGKSRYRLNPQAKLYNDLEGIDFETANTGGDFNPKTLADDPNTTFTPLGKITIDGHECIKIEAKRQIKGRENEKIYLYAAKDLKNLIIAAQVLNPPYAMIQRLSNISLEVPDNLVNLPDDYKAIEKDVWRKVENAKVKYGGKFSKDFGVFRSPTGELFVYVIDAPYPWKYLIRPKEATAETAYQGMLITRNGEFIWRTKETEALSETGYRSASAVRDKDDTKPVQIKSNTLKFQSNNSDDIWIEVILPEKK